MKSKIYHDPSVISESDEMYINSKILEFVIDGIRFEPQVVKSKAAFALPYNPVELQEIFANKTVLSDDYKINIKPKFKAKKAPIESKKEIKEQSLALLDSNEQDLDNLQISNAQIKFKSKNFFMNKSLSEERLSARNENDSRNVSKLTRSLDDLSESMGSRNGVFITETNLEYESESPNKQKRKVSFDLSGDLSLPMEEIKKVRNKSPARTKIKDLNEVKWDDYVINMLNENTARWLVMKNTSDRNYIKILILKDIVFQTISPHTKK